MQLPCQIPATTSESHSLLLTFRSLELELENREELRPPSAVQGLAGVGGGHSAQGDFAWETFHVG